MWGFGLSWSVKGIKRLLQSFLAKSCSIINHLREITCEGVSVYGKNTICIRIAKILRYKREYLSCVERCQHGNEQRRICCGHGTVRQWENDTAEHRVRLLGLSACSRAFGLNPAPSSIISKESKWFRSYRRTKTLFSAYRQAFLITFSNTLKIRERSPLTSQNADCSNRQFYENVGWQHKIDS